MAESNLGPQIWVRGPVLVEERPSDAGKSTCTQGQQQAPPPEVAWISVHGGAGASTLATLVGGVDIGNRWPDPGQGEPTTVLLVGRTHAAGLKAVSQTLDIFRRGEQPPGLQVVAVVLVADAPGRPPRELNQRIKIISSAVAVHRVPWVPAWRTGELKGAVPREVSALAQFTGHPTQ